MTQRIVIILTAFIFFGSACFAQNSKDKWGIGIHPSTFSFYAGFDSSFLDLGEYEHGVQFSINRHFSNLLDVGLEGSTAILRHPAGENNPDNGGLWRDFFYNANPFIKVKANNGFLLKKNSFVMPFLKAGIGVNKYKTADLGISAPLGAGIGFKFKDAGYLVVQSSYNLGVANSESYLQHSLGFVINLKGGNYRRKASDQTDTDKDGIPDVRDECPEIAASKSKTGCPDMDEDGVQDSDDLCPRKKGLASLNGCLDQDKDGVPDPLDKCPTTFGSQANKGCPQSAAPDKDNDKVEDELDQCPTLPGHWSGQGCPDQDGDGIVDDKDVCPNLFGGTRYNGCPFNEQGMKDLNDGFAPNGVSVFIEEGGSSSIYTPTINTPPVTVPDQAAKIAEQNRIAALEAKRLADLEAAKQAEQAKIDAELKAKQEAERLANEQANRTAEQNRIAALETKRLADLEAAKQAEQAKIDAELKAKQEAERLATEQANRTAEQDRLAALETKRLADLEAAKQAEQATNEDVKTTVTKDAIPCGLPEGLLRSARQSIRFEKNKATLTADSKILLNKIATLLKPCPATLTIRAHTDDEGEAEYNLRLSERRAQSVSRYLIELGLDRKYIQTSGAGESEPIVANDSVENKAKNRRVEFIVMPR